ncbi:MAG: tRNA (adenosine(37)-N6)-threonylcarbamoyltransferase complex ATPase subunit type 1 TsaE [Candidatus Portnoybacteria bacterium]|nr:tRNA (adenosine(37)-N6)-threonylcarbamoyltransferase complex ATPase subunit type 1 TsaE [Candidatus Portnoybacteria bacterium]
MRTTSALQTKKIAQTLGEEILASRKGILTVVALCGELGAGKTTFVKGLAKSLGIKVTITSPTFILINKYQIPNTRYKILNTFYHIDPYRLKDTEDILPELKELLAEKNAVIAIEWAERLKNLLPIETIWTELKHRGENKRELRIMNYERGIKKMSKL